MSCLPGFPRKSCRIGVPAQLLFLFISLFCASTMAAATLAAQASWTVIGPDGGDARSFAFAPGQPRHLFLGTTNSWLYESLDEGATWHRLAKLDRGDGFVLDSIVVDSANPATIYVGAWKDSSDGGLWISHDSGHTWRESPEFKGQPIYAFTQAPSDPHILFAGTLQGVFRSGDSGVSWSRISPSTGPESHEIHEIESLAVDPANPDILYAGTWHLPWKTTDGGRTWHNIKEGLIVDSDVFSIIVDPAHPRVVYLSACSGIYKSENAGALFRKIQGIPTEARRTRVLMQDPENRDVVYAGTTEGLYKTLNAGKTFKRMTDADVIINDVYVDPGDSNHVLLATDRGGVLVSQDAGATFAQSNIGISERKIAALLVDRDDPQRVYAGVVNDKNFGGVFRSIDGGAHWQQLSSGLDGRDVFSLAEAADGAIVAGTSHGIFVLDNAANSDPPAGKEKASADAPPADPTWQPRNTIANTIVKTATQTVRGSHVNVEKQVPAAKIELQSGVNALDVSGDVWVAATSYGLLTSRDQGATWQGGPVMGVGDYLSVTVHDTAMVAVRADSAVLSKDAGQTWWPMALPTSLTRIHRVAFSPDGTLWLGAREGVYFTRDLGKTWMWMQRFPLRDIDDMSYDATLKRMLVSSRVNDQVFAIDLKSMTWDWWRTGYQIALIRSAGDRLVAASLNDGVLAGPKTTTPAAPPAVPAQALTHPALPN